MHLIFRIVFFIKSRIYYTKCHINNGYKKKKQKCKGVAVFMDTDIFKCSECPYHKK